jgi:hypothetical protein
MSTYPVSLHTLKQLQQFGVLRHEVSSGGVGLFGVGHTGLKATFRLEGRGTARAEDFGSTLYLVDVRLSRGQIFDLLAKRGRNGNTLEHRIAVLFLALGAERGAVVMLL